MNLEDLRKDLSAIDRKLVEMIAERQKIVGEIGRTKQTHGTATRDYAREKDVLDMGRAQAQEMGVDPDLVRKPAANAHSYFAREPGAGPRGR